MPIIREVITLITRATMPITKEIVSIMATNNMPTNSRIRMTPEDSISTRWSGF